MDVDRHRLLSFAAAIYLIHAVALFAMMPRDRLIAHSPYNHYALQAEAWLHGRLDLGVPPPPYTGNNDFALHEGKHYVSFPPVPAAMLLPLVAIAGGADRVRDPQFFAWLAPLGPVLFFVALERLRRAGRLRRRRWTNAALATVLGLGTVYWFSAVQGSVWFAGHVVTMVATCGYLLCSIGARRPWLAGLALALAVGTRPTLAFAVPLFVYEAFRAHPSAPWRRLGSFAAPLMAMFALLAWYNYARFGDPTEFGHRLLTVVWRERIERWGLFSFHYLGRNLSVSLTGMPFHTPGGGWQINAHGLALWLTTPVFLWALWPRRAHGLFWAAAACAAAVAIPNLLYQNTGWLQFGYRFSNDFAPFLMLMVAAGGRRLGVPFWLLASWSVAINGFGALTFDRAEFAHVYFIDRSQKILVQPD